DTVFVTADQISRLNRDSTDHQGIVHPTACAEVLARTANTEPSREHRKRHRTQQRAIANAAVDHQTAEAANLRGSGHDLTPIAVVVLVAHMHDQHVARLSRIDRTMQPEIVTPG